MTRSSTGRGAVFIEFAIVAPLFFLFVLGLIDLSRYWGARNVLQAGVGSGANLAARIEALDVTLVAAPTTIEQYDRNRFLVARAAVIAESLRLPSSVLHSNWNRQSLIQLIPFSLNLAGLETTSDNAGAVVVRPLETYRKALGLGFDGLGVPSYTHDFPPPPLPVRTMGSLLKDFPVVVYAESRFRWFLPFMGQSVLRAKAMTFRERVWDGTLPEIFQAPPTTSSINSTTIASSSTSTAPSTSSTTSTSTTSTSSTSTTSTSTTSTSTSSTSTTSTSTTSTSSTSTTSTSTTSTSSTSTTSTSTTSTSTSSTSTTSTSTTSTSTTSTTSTSTSSTTSVLTTTTSVTTSDDE